MEMRRSTLAMIHQDPRAAINPLRTIGDFMTEGVRHLPRDERFALAASALADVGIDGRRAALPAVPAPTVRRAAAAGDDRRGPDARAAAGPGGRADDRAGRHLAVGGDGDPERPAAGPRCRDGLHHARPGSRRGGDGLAGGHVRRCRSSSPGPRQRSTSTPLHPYTVALLASRPDPRTVQPLRTIPGRPASAFEVGEGCPFAARCPFVQDRCRETRPLLRLVEGQFGRLPPSRRVARPHPRRTGGGQLTAEIVVADGLRKVFRLSTKDGHEDFVAVEGASFTVHQGECLAIVGESGSGKSTIARMIAGLEAPTSGQVLVEGIERPPLPWSRSPPARARAAGADGVPGPELLTRPEPDHRGEPGRGAAHPLPGGDTGRAPGAGGRAARPGRPRRPAPRHAPALDVGRREAAGRHRARPGGAAAAAHPRRGRVGARRQRAGARPQSAHRPPARAGPDLPVHLARPRRRPAGQRHRDRHASRPGGGGRDDDGHPRQPPVGLHAVACSRPSRGPGGSPGVEQCVRTRTRPRRPNWRNPFWRDRWAHSGEGGHLGRAGRVAGASRPRPADRCPQRLLHAVGRPEVGMLHRRQRQPVGDRAQDSRRRGRGPSPGTSPDRRSRSRARMRSSIESKK